MSSQQNIIMIIITQNCVINYIQLTYKKH